jgi:hypothetical protein
MPFDDGPLNVGSEECQSQKLAHAPPMKPLARRQIVDIDDIAGLDRSPPPVRARQSRKESFICARQR